jgi:hypothetical protein
MARYRYALLLTAVVAVLADDLVVLKQGRLKGHRLTTRKGRDIFAFQGIPYAKPPVGKLRFQVRSTGVREFLSANRRDWMGANWSADIRHFDLRRCPVRKMGTVCLNQR